MVPIKSGGRSNELNLRQDKHIAKPLYCYRIPNGCISPVVHWCLQFTACTSEVCRACLDLQAGKGREGHKICWEYTKRSEVSPNNQSEDELKSAPHLHSNYHKVRSLPLFNFVNQTWEVIQPQLLIGELKTQESEKRGWQEMLRWSDCPTFGGA